MVALNLKELQKRGEARHPSQRLSLKLISRNDNYVIKNMNPALIRQNGNPYRTEILKQRHSIDNSLQNGRSPPDKITTRVVVDSHRIHNQQLQPRKLNQSVQVQERGKEEGGGGEEGKGGRMVE